MRQFGGAVRDDLQHLLALVGVLTVPVGCDLQPAIGLLVDSVKQILPNCAAGAVLRTVCGVEGPFDGIRGRGTAVSAVSVVAAACAKGEGHTRGHQPSKDFLERLFHDCLLSSIAESHFHIWLNV